MNSQPAILYVEDEESDILLFRVAVQRTKLPNKVHCAVDGAEAIDYLAGNGRFSDRDRHPVPTLMLLDLNLPKKSGFQVLQWVRQQPSLSGLPVVIYTSSDHDADKETARQLGASDYIIKKFDVNQISELIRSLAARWLPPSEQSQQR